MDSRELKDIIEEIKIKEETDLKEIAAAAGLDRSYLSKFINSPTAKEVTRNVRYKLNKAFPAYFPERVVSRGNKQQGPDTLAQALEIIKQQNEYLQRLLDVSLTDLSNNILKGRAEVRAFGEYQVIKDAKGSDERRKAIMAQINKLVVDNLIGDG